MRRPRRAITVAVALAVVVASSAHAAAPAVTATVEPAEPLFGDAFAYVIEAIVPSAGADGISVVSDVGPFTRVAATRESRTEVNGVTRIRVTETLACLTAGCLPRVQGSAVLLPTPRVTGSGAVPASPPVEVRVRTRIPSSAIKVASPVLHRPAELPEATVRVEPRLAQAVLGVVGLVLVAFGVLLAAAPLHRRRRDARRAVEMNSVERTVRLLRESTARDATDRRRAAGLASRVAAEPELSVDAAEVAWSRAEPGPPDAATLADRLERLVEPTAVGGP